jgi:ubiquitin-protein ligase E3 C
VSVRRRSVAQDGFERLEGADLKAAIEITFIDRFAQEDCLVSFLGLSFTIS